MPQTYHPRSHLAPATAALSAHEQQQLKAGIGLRLGALRSHDDHFFIPEAATTQLFRRADPAVSPVCS